MEPSLIGLYYYYYYYEITVTEENIKITSQTLSLCPPSCKRIKAMLHLHCQKKSYCKKKKTKRWGDINTVLFTCYVLRRAGY